MDNSTAYERTEIQAWRELNLTQREKDDHRLAFALGVIEEVGRTIAASNGMKTDASTDPDRYYIKLEEPGKIQSDKIRKMFESIQAIARAKNGTDNRNS